MKRSFTFQKRKNQNQTQPSYNFNYYFQSNISEEIIIQKLKRALPSDNNQSKNNQNNKQFNKKCNQSPTKLDHKILYKRGIRAQRGFYNNLTTQICQLQQKIPSIQKLNSVEIFHFKQKYLNEYLMEFFKLLGEQCYQKSIFVSKLWLTLKQIFQELIKRLINQLNCNQKQYLKQCHLTHERYQQKFQDFKKQIENRNKEINRLRQIISKIAFKRINKCRKNKQITQGFRQIVGRLSTVEKQRNQLKCQYINMLTLGYTGGMEYNQAKRYTIKKFGIDNQLIFQNQNEDSNSCNQAQKVINKKNIQICEWEKKKKNILKIQKNCQALKQNISKAKRKYIYGPTRNLISQNGLESDSEINLQQFLNQRQNGQIQTHQLQQSKNSFSSSRTIDKVKNFANDKCMLNKRIQTTFNFNLVQTEKDCFGTDLSNTQKYKDDLIKNKEVQTQKISKKLNYTTFIDNSTQYQKQYFKDNMNKTQLNQLQIQTFNIKQIAQLPYKLKMSIQFEKPSQYTIQNQIIKEDPIIQKKSSQEASQKDLLEIEQQESLSIIEVKKRQIKSKRYQKKNINKKQNRPSIFNRHKSSMVSITNNFLSIQNSITHQNKKKKFIQQRKQSFDQFLKNKQEACISNLINKLDINNNRIFSNKTQTSAIQNQIYEQDDTQKIQFQQDYLRTDMLSVMQSMSKLSPKGICIDQAMVFLLKKSLFRIKHDNCDNVLKKNFELITRVRTSVLSMKNFKAQSLLSMKSVCKILRITYDAALSQLFQRNISHKPQRNKNRRGSQNQSLRKQIQFGNHEVIKVNKEINLLELLKNAIKKEHSMYKNDQIEHKIVLMMKCIEEQTNPNHFVKNFVLLSCFDNNIFSQVIFSSDVQFYFHLLLQLNVKGNQIKYLSENIGRNQIGKFKPKARASGQFDIKFNNEQIETKNEKNYKIFSINGSYENLYTNIKKLRQALRVFLKQFYKKQALLIFIENKIISSVQKIQLSQNQSIQNARLDLFKCCQLVMQSIFSYKLDVLKSYAQLTQIEQLSTFGLMNQQLFIDIIGFLKISKLQKLNIINKFRYDFGKTNTVKGINLINMVNFCLNHNLPDFDQILYDVIKNYLTNDQINKKILKLETTYRKFQKLQKISKFLYYKNKKAIETTSADKILKGDFDNDHLTQIKEQNSLSFIEDRNKGVQKNSENIFNKIAKKTTIRLSKKEQKNTKDIWQIIGIPASNSLIHFKIVQLQSSQLLQIILGQNLINLYMASLCQLQQKIYIKNST